jgi:hypothetical protein
VQLLPTGAHEALVATESTGLAASTAYLSTPQGGRTRISIEVLRPDPLSATAQPVVVGRGETSVEWQAPAIALTHTGPITVPVGQPATFTIAVRNNAAAATPAYTVRSDLPDGAEFVRSDPPAIRQGDTLIWTLGELVGGATRQMQVTVKSSRVGSLTSKASVVTAEGLHDEQTVTSDVVPPPAPKLEATLTAPTTAIFSQGVNGAAPVPIACQVVVRNPGNGPATNVVLSALFKDEILTHDSKKCPVDIPVGTLKPGEARTVSLMLTPRFGGETPISVTAKADGNLTAKSEARNLKVIETGVVVKLTGPASRFVGRPDEWTVEVRNTGQVALQQVVVRDLLPPELQFVEAPEARLNGNEVTWNVGDLPAGGVKVLKLVTKGIKPAKRVLNTAYVTAQTNVSQSLKPGETGGLPGGVLQTKADAYLDLQGAAAFKLKVADKVDPIHVGERDGYTIQVANQGSLDGEHVQVVCTIPPEMRVVGVWGPGAYRVTGSRLEFQPVEHLPPGSALSYAIDVEPIKPGDARLRVELTSTTLNKPVVKEESTIVRSNQ